jgi:hypothetical protein
MEDMKGASAHGGACAMQHTPTQPHITGAPRGAGAGAGVERTQGAGAHAGVAGSAPGAACQPLQPHMPAPQDRGPALARGRMGAQLVSPTPRPAGWNMVCGLSPAAPAPSYVELPLLPPHHQPHPRASECVSALTAGEPPARMLVIRGPPGCGKATLAVEVAHQLVAEGHVGEEGAGMPANGSAGPNHAMSCHQPQPPRQGRPVLPAAHPAVPHLHCTRRRRKICGRASCGA